MAMKIAVLASSSRGNASVITAGGTTLLVDVGISARRIKLGLEACGLSLGDIHGICITHEHTDHVGGLAVLSGKVKAKIYCSRYLRADLKSLAPDATYAFLEPGTEVRIGDFTVLPISVSHDAVDPLGYVFEADGVRLGYITDTGCITRTMVPALQGVQVLYLESNYDQDMLYDSGRPQDLIGRIEGQWGHLSNAQAGEFVRQIAHRDLRHIILAHLSPECNTPDCAAAAMQAVLDDLHHPATLHVARQAELLPWVQV